MTKILAIVGARPQFIKHYPFEQEAIKHFDLVTVHTGQHYDDNMSQVFFDELGMRPPDYMLDIGSGSHGNQTGRMMIELENVMQLENPEWVVVYGDTNSTLAGALVAAKLHIPIAHVEAGLRSYNREMPEEINRIVADQLSTLLFVPNEAARNNLGNEGIIQGVYEVGDLMKDLVMQCQREGKIGHESLRLQPYYYATIHRPYNTDDSDRLSMVLDALQDLHHPVIFAMHPRTRHAMKRMELEAAQWPNIEIIDPVGYLDNLTFLYHSEALLTDSGGMQKEAYWLKKKCVTMRTETEWTETLEHGWNHLVFQDLEALESVLTCPSDGWMSLYGNGQAAQSICRAILELD